MNQARGNILVIRGGAIGDFILTLPALAALRRRFPKAQLALLGHPPIARLALAGGLVDELRSLECRALAGFFARDGALDESLAGYLAGCAVVVSYLYDPDGIFQTNVARCSKAQFIAGPHRPDEKLNLHATETFLKPLERLAIDDADPIPRLELAATAPGAEVPRPPALETTRPSDAPSSAGAEDCGRGQWLALHPGSGSERKNWPEKNWRELIARLLDETAFGFLLVGGEAENDRLQRLSATLPIDRVLLAQSRPLTELAYLLKRCVGFIGHDSGITHLAAALELPVLVLWGETNRTVWRPRGKNVTVITSPEGITGIAVSDVSAEARRWCSG